MGPGAGTERDVAIFDCDKGPSSAGWATNAKGIRPISGGIVVVAYGVPPGGIQLLYEVIDHTSGTTGTDSFNATEDGQSHLLGFSIDEDSGYFPGDNVTVSVRKYVPGGNDTYGIPQHVIDDKSITLGEAGGVVSLSTKYGMAR